MDSQPELMVLSQIQLHDEFVSMVQSPYPDRTMYIEEVGSASHEPNQGDADFEAWCAINGFNDLDEQIQEEQLNENRMGLIEEYAKVRMAGYFDIGKVIGDRFTIISKFSGAEGSFNRGIYLVEDNSGQGNGILKLLPTFAMNPGFAAREVDVLARLDHRNIVTLYQSHIPHHSHDTPWLVTEFCDKSTLKDLLRSQQAKDQSMPELFAWQIFISLTEAATYCHNGNAVDTIVDEITHRDIILGNIFMKTDERTASREYEYPFTIKLGDWGCAITQSEWVNGDIEVDELPVVDPAYEPPEQAWPGESTDVYQIGATMWCIFCLMVTPDQDLVNSVRLPVWWGQRAYSKDLRDSIIACLKKDPEERPSVSYLLDDLHRKRALLIANGLLNKVPSDWLPGA